MPLLPPAVADSEATARPPELAEVECDAELRKECKRSTLYDGSKYMPVRKRPAGSTSVSRRRRRSSIGSRDYAAANRSRGRSTARRSTSYGRACICLAGCGTTTANRCSSSIQTVGVATWLNGERSSLGRLTGAVNGGKNDLTIGGQVDSPSVRASLKGTKVLDGWAICIGSVVSTER